MKRAAVLLDKILMATRRGKSIHPQKTLYMEKPDEYNDPKTYTSNSKRKLETHSSDRFLYPGVSFI